MAETDDLDEAVAYLKTIAREFAITRGGDGALVWDGAQRIDIDPVKVDPIDTVGAGDMFAGAFLYGLTQGWDHRQAGDLASALSAKLVTSLGPRLSPDDTRSVLRSLT
jgi:sugar/nucleoside kinase (ribokinase family)